MVVKRAGMPSGSLRCVVNVPNLDLVDRLRFSACRMSKLRSFLKKRRPAQEDAREGATFTISAEIRHRDNQGYRWVFLCRWRAGESVNNALDEARHNSKELDERGQRLLLEEPLAADQFFVKIVDRLDEICAALTDDASRLLRTELKTVQRGGIKWFGHLLLAVNDRLLDAAFRMVVCHLLQVIGDPIAAVPLARALADAADDEALVWAAANALAALRTNSATPILIDVLETGTPVQRAAATWMLARSSSGGN